MAVALTGEAFVDALRRIWDSGDAVLPVDPRLPPPARDALLDAMAPASIIEPDGTIRTLDRARPVASGDALVVPTSGSTGTPKGVVHTHAGLEASARSVSAALEVDPDRDVWLCCLPLSHIAGLAVIVRALTLGTGLMVHDRFDATAVVAAAEAGASLTALVPTALARLDPGAFRRIIVGGSAPPASMPANCSASYGMTETGSAVVLDHRPLPGVELRIVDGEIQIRGPMLMRSYRDGTDPRTPDGWFPSGDEGYIDASGRLEVFGRRGDLIITGGENVWPEPVEQIIAALASVREVAVVGRPDPEWGQVVTAVVVPTDDGRPPTLEDLRTAVRSVMPAFNAPRRLELVPSLPRTGLGKIRRAEL